MASSSRLRNTKLCSSPLRTQTRTSTAPLRQPTKALHPCRRTSRQEIQCGSLLSAVSRCSAGLQPASNILRVVRQNHSRARPLNSRKNLEHYALFVQPAALRRGFHHRIFTAHVVGGHRNVKFLAHALDHVQIWHRRLHHHHVRAFFQIERHFAQRLARVRRIHLIAAPIAKLRRRLRRFSKRTI